MQRPRLEKTGGEVTAAECELRQRGSGARRKKGGREARRAGLFIRRAHKSGRENQGDRGVVISPRNASIFGMTVNAEIRCGSLLLLSLRKSRRREGEITTPWSP